MRAGPPDIEGDKGAARRAADPSRARAAMVSACPAAEAPIWVCRAHLNAARSVRVFGAVGATPRLSLSRRELRRAPAPPRDCRSRDGTWSDGWLSTQSGIGPDLEETDFSDRANEAKRELSSC